MFTTWRNLREFSKNNGGCIGNREEVHGSNEDKVYRLASLYTLRHLEEALLGSLNIKHWEPGDSEGQ